MKTQLVLANAGSALAKPVTSPAKMLVPMAKPPVRKLRRRHLFDCFPGSNPGRFSGTSSSRIDEFEQRLPLQCSQRSH
jgi:hypothetical protein